MALPAVDSDGIDLNLAHLQAELARIDVLVRRAVYRWQRAGQDRDEPFRGLHISDDDAVALLDRPFASGWGNLVDLPEGEEQAFEQAAARAAAEVSNLVQTAIAQDEMPRLLYLGVAFDLDRTDLDILLICLAPALDLRYGRLYAYLQDDVTRKLPTPSLILDLLCDPGPEERLPALLYLLRDGPLFQNRLLERGEEGAGTRTQLLGQALKVNDTVLSWLLGDYLPGDELASRAQLSWPDGTNGDNVLAAPVRREIERVAVGEKTFVVFSGPDDTSREAAARLLAASMKLPLLSVDLAPGGASAETTSPQRALRLALRDARLTGSVLYLREWDSFLGAAGAAGADLVRMALEHPGAIVLGTREFWQPVGMDRGRSISRIDFRAPSYGQRVALWEHFLTEAEAPFLTDSQSALPALAGQFVLTTGQIRDAVASARDRAAQRGEPLNNADLLAAARAHSSPRLSTLTRKITPRYRWEDIVLPPDQLAMLREIVATVRGRPQVLEEWGVGRKLASSCGVTILFAGPPGTGKTMAAEVIAAELALDLYKIDLSTVVSKYIGETEKNLEQIFSEAQNSNAILFFDEADAIFGKRSEVKDAHDRYANIEISYLLQRMEAYDGVTILATNLRANLDEAFTRRLQFALDFPFPEEEYRRRIWETLFPPDVPRTADLDFDLLARRFRLAGGSIRNIIVSAAYLASADGKRVGMNHLLHGVRRELQKMGRLVNENDLVV